MCEGLYVALEDITVVVLETGKRTSNQTRKTSWPLSASTRLTRTSPVVAFCLKFKEVRVGKELNLGENRVT